MYKVSGRVIHGEKIGKVLGYPTANLDRRGFVKLKKKPKLGVWAGYATYRLQAKTHKLKAAIVIGPIDKKGLPKVEVYLIGFKGNLYGTYLNTYLNRYIRPFKKYKDVEKLKAQIKKDIQRIRELEN